MHFWDAEELERFFLIIGELVCWFSVLLGPAFELLYSTLPNGIVAADTRPRATSPMSSPRFKGTMLMGGLASTIDEPVLASAEEQRGPLSGQAVLRSSYSPLPAAPRGSFANG